MLRRIYFVILILVGMILTGSASAAEPNLLYQGHCFWETGDVGVVHREVAADSEGNLYVTGFFGFGITEADFDCTSGTDIKQDGGTWSAIFITRYNADGSYGWTRVVNGPSPFYGEGKSIHIYDNKVYVGGFFDGTDIDFDGTGGTDLLTKYGSTDAFVTVYSTSGDYIDTYQIGGTSQENLDTMELDGSGNVVLTGYFEGTIDFDLGAGTNELAAPHRSQYLVKYNNDFGSVVFAYKLQGSDWANRAYIRAIAIDGNDNIFVGGYFKDTNMDLDPTVGTDLYTTSFDDIFFSKYTPSGGYEWSRRIGNTANYEYVHELEVDSDGNLYIVGYVGFGTIDFDATGGVDNKTATLTDGYLTKYGNDGSYVMTYLYSSDDVVEIEDVELDAYDNVYIYGDFTSDNADLDGTAGGTDYDSLGQYDTFVTRYTQDLTFDFTRRYGGTWYDQAWKMATNGTDRVYLSLSAGSFGSLNIEGVGDVSKGNDEIPLIISYMVDSAIPTLTITNIETTTDRSPTVNGTATDASGTVAGVDYQVDGTGGSWNACTSDDGAWDEVSEAFTCDTTQELAYGDHTIYFLISDSNGNSGVSPTSESLKVIEGESTGTGGTTVTTVSPGSFPIIYASEATDSVITIKFIPGVGPLTHYTLEYGRDKHFLEYGATNLGDDNSREFTVADLSPHTRYYFRLIPMNNELPGPSSPLYAARTLTTQVAEKDELIITQIELIDTLDELEVATEAGQVVGELTVKVIDEEEEPVEGAEVTLEREEEPEGEVLSATTNEEGDASFGEVSSGTYIVSVVTEEQSYRETIEVEGADTKLVTVKIETSESDEGTMGIGARINEIGLGQGQIKDLIEGTWGVPVLVGDITQQAAPAALTVTGATIAVSWLGGLVNLFGIISRGLMSIYTQIGRHKWMLPYDLLLALSHRLGAWTGFWRKGKKTWGVVFESMTGEPVSGAYVLFYSKSGNLTTDFTDRRGRYFLEPAPDSYEVKVEADNYLFPAKKDLTGVVQFSNIYVKGQIILVNEKRKFMRVAIPLDKLVAGWREKTSYYLAKIRYWVSLIAILASFYTILVRPDNRMNWIVVILACWYWGLYILGKTISAMKEE